MSSTLGPSYRFDFGLGVSYGRGLPAGYGYVVRSTESPGKVASGSFAYRLDDLPMARAVGRSLPPMSADAIDVAGAVYVADRLAPRHDPGIELPPSERWPRRMRLRIPVREPGRWRNPIVRDGVERLLHYLTGDHWEIELRPRSTWLAPRSAEHQHSLLAQLPYAEAQVILHSGGLDGALGLLDVVLRAGRGIVVPASVTTSALSREVQDQIVVETARALRPRCPDLRGARVYANLSGVRRSHQESSQRARGFLYLTTGLVASCLVGNDRLYVAEHGTGAINLPYTPDQTGARVSRTVHPRALALFSDLFSTLFDRPIRVDNLLLWETKGEACSRLSEEVLLVARKTVSCDRFPRRDPNRPCGQCTNCLVRRAALVASGWETVDRHPGRVLEFDPAASDASWAGRDLVPLYALRAQANELRRACAAPNPGAALVAAFPELAEVVALHRRWGLSSADVEDRLVRLYQAYVREIEGLFGTFARPGWGTQASISSFTYSPLPATG